MPYVSEAQRGFLHAAEDRGEIDPEVVEKFDRESKGQKNLPYRKKKVQKSAVLLVPFLLEKARPSRARLEAAGQVGMDFDEEAHPRAPKGDTQHHGGEFVKKEDAAIQVPLDKPEEAPRPDQVWNDTRLRLEEDLKGTAAKAAELVKEREDFRRGEYEAAYRHNQEITTRNNRIKRGPYDRATNQYEGGRPLTATEEDEQREARERLDSAFQFIKNREDFAEEKAIPGLKAALFAHLLTNPNGWDKASHLQLDHEFKGRESSFPVGADLGFVGYGTDPKRGSIVEAIAVDDGQARRIRVPLDWVKPASAGPNPFQVCTRCGGSGEYSYNQSDGTRCFGCGGSGVQTKKSKVKKALRLVVPKEVREAPQTQTGLADFLGEAPDEILDPESKPPAKPRVHRRYPERRHSQGGRAKKLILPLDPK